MTPDEHPGREHPHDPDRPISPEEDARVRALLASVQTPAMPAEVAARLQDTIRQEAQARAAAPGPVASLQAARSRRRRLVPLLAAAAVTVGVLAVAVPVVVDQRDGQTGASSDEGAARPSAGEAAREPSAAEEKPRNDAAAPSGRVPRLTTSGFADEVRSRLSGAERQPRPQAVRPSTLRCTGGRVVSPGAIEVALDGSPASVIAYGPESARVFEALGCGTGTPVTLAKATLDLR